MTSYHQFYFINLYISYIKVTVLFQNDVYVFAKEYFHPFNPAPLKYKPLIVVGPSGVGKGTLTNTIITKYGNLFERKVSYTTRQKKAYEKSEGNYYFITREEFMRVITSNFHCV